MSVPRGSAGLAWQDSEFTSTSKVQRNLRHTLNSRPMMVSFTVKSMGNTSPALSRPRVRDRIHLNSEVTRCERTGTGWSVAVNGGEAQDFDYLILCSGLANRPKQQLEYMANLTELESKTEQLEGKTILIVGGGESRLMWRLYIRRTTKLFSR